MHKKALDSTYGDVHAKLRIMHVPDSSIFAERKTINLHIMAERKRGRKKNGKNVPDILWPPVLNVFRKISKPAYDKQVLSTRKKKKRLFSRGVENILSDADRKTNFIRLSKNGFCVTRKEYKFHTRCVKKFGT